MAIRLVYDGGKAILIDDLIGDFNDSFESKAAKKGEDQTHFLHVTD